MSVWLTIPSAKPAAQAQECIDAWASKGYRVAIWRDTGAEPVKCDITLWGAYPGYAKACNALIREVAGRVSDAEWFICAGDDIWPDPYGNPERIARQCARHFGAGDILDHGDAEHLFSTFGVMQPTGDPWSDAQGRMIERIAGSPWIGRDFALRTYGGRGPYWEEYTHCFLDNELMDVAKMLGVYWMRPDLTHDHRHWTRERRPMPQYLRNANSQEHWKQYMRIWQQRKAAGYPGHQPLAEVAA